MLLPSIQHPEWLTSGGPFIKLVPTIATWLTFGGVPMAIAGAFVWLTFGGPPLACTVCSHNSWYRGLSTRCWAQSWCRPAQSWRRPTPALARCPASSNGCSAAWYSHGTSTGTSVVVSPSELCPLWMVMHLPGIYGETHVAIAARGCCGERSGGGGGCGGVRPPKEGREAVLNQMPAQRGNCEKGYLT